MEPPVVTQVQAPVTVLAVTGLRRVDYSDCFRVETGLTLSPREWAELMLNQAAPTLRASLIASWMLMGLGIAPWRSGRVLGWRTYSGTPDLLIVSATSRLGMDARLAFRADPGGFSMMTVIELRGPLATAAWTRIEPQHVKVVHALAVAGARRAVAGAAPVAV